MHLTDCLCLQARELDDLDAIVIPGSHHTAVPNDSDNHPAWMLRVMELIRECAARGRPQILGVCFGHQLVAAALGGTVSSSESFVFKAEEVELREPSWSNWAQRVGLQVDEVADGAAGTRGVGPRLRLLESHGDFVASLPPQAIALGGSPSCEHELYAVGDSVLCMQGHPEFTPELLKERILPALQVHARTQSHSPATP